MIKVTYEYYYNDYTRQQNIRQSFSSLNSFKEWIETKAVGDVHSDKVIWWPHYKESDTFKFNVNNGWICNIRMIENNEGIIFTDGFYTQHRRHSSQEFYEWCQEQIHQQKQAVVRFVK